MLCNILLTALGTWVGGVYADDGWCRAAPQPGLPDYAKCLSIDQAVARYVFEVAPLVAFGLELKSDVKLVVEGSNGRRTKAISIASLTGGTSKRVTADRVDVSNPEVIHAYITSPTAWACRRITVWKDFRYWIFDCGEALSPLSPETVSHAHSEMQKYCNGNGTQSFTLSGSKTYELSVLTGTDPKGGAHHRARITLIGSLRSSGPKVLEGNFPPGSTRILKVQSADVGNLEAVILTNDSVTAPWFCKHVTVRVDGSIASFKVARWIGAPYSPAAYILRYPSESALELASQDIDCHTRAADIFEGLPSSMNVLKVHCPINCQASEFAHTQGSSLHPSSSSICTSAILDGVMSPSGGDILVTAVGPVEQYTGAAFSGIQSMDFSYFPERQQYSFHTYLVDSIDLINTTIRIVNEFGQLSSVGRLEVKTGGGWGTVCNKGDFLSFSPEAAVKACQELELASHYSTVAKTWRERICAQIRDILSHLQCKGNESSLADCSSEKPTATCLDHRDDVVIKCTNRVSGVEPQTGAIRIVGLTGTPAQTGIGRLQYYNNGFGSVCSDGWTLQSEQVACRQMGYNSVKDKGPGSESCSSIMGQNFCGQDQERIVAVNFACTGRELALNQCPHLVGDDIYCVHEEDVVVACEGDGDPSGIGAYRREEAPGNKGRISWASRIHAPCCVPPELTAGGALKGSFIYTSDSAICRAAIHSGTTTQDGGECVVVVGHGQNHFSAFESHGIQSEENGMYSRSFTVARVDHSLYNFLISPPPVSPMLPQIPPAQPTTSEYLYQAGASTAHPVSIIPNTTHVNALPTTPTGASIQSGQNNGGGSVVPQASGQLNPLLANNAATQTGNPKVFTTPTAVMQTSLFGKDRGWQRGRSTKSGSISAMAGGDSLAKRNPYASVKGATSIYAAPASAKRSERSGLPASSFGTYTRMTQLRNSPNTKPEEIFHWFPPEGHKGFHGKPADFVDVSSLAEGSLVSSIRDFTVVTKASVTGGEGTWRTIVAHSDCDGFALVVDRSNELIFEQTCHPHQIKSGFKPKTGEVFDAAASFSTTSRLIQLFVNGKAVASEKTDFDIALRGRMVIGRASAAEADYFQGDILGVKLFNREIPGPVVQTAFSPETLAAHVPQAPSESRRTDDGRLCLSLCSSRRPDGAVAAATPTKPAVVLSCADSLRRSEFNGYVGQQILALCPPDCLHAGAPLEGCKIFTSKSSICKAGLHEGAIPKEGGELVVTIIGGLTSYDASRGHFGIRSSQSTIPQLRSFSVETAPLFRAVSCETSGMFTLKLGVGERELIVCPPGCAANVNAVVFGSGFYSPVSSICRAALHAGALNDAGGEVEIIASDARQRFMGTERFGITSESSGSYVRSLVFVTPNLQQ